MFCRYPPRLLPTNQLVVSLAIDDSAVQEVIVTPGAQTGGIGGHDIHHAGCLEQHTYMWATFDGGVHDAILNMLLAASGRVALGFQV